MEEERKKRRWWVRPLVFILFIGAVYGGYRASKEFLYDVEAIGSSMEPSLAGGERATGLKASHVGEIARGDILVFEPPFDAGRLYVKRVIGLPGEDVRIESGKVYVDGELLDESYIAGEWTQYTGPYVFHVPDGHYLMLGDNRDESWDARHWDDPYVGRSAVKAKALVVYWPVKQFRYLY